MHFHHSINVYYAFKHVYKHYLFLVNSHIKSLLNCLSFSSVYSAAIQEAYNVLYDGLIEELVEVLHVRDPTLTVSSMTIEQETSEIFTPSFSSLKDIKASALKTLTSIIHLERTSK